jgi:hypothetical protein
MTLNAQGQTSLMPPGQPFNLKASLSVNPVMAQQPLLRLDLSNQGKPVDKLAIIHEKPLHTFLISENLNTFQHLHPVAAGQPGQFTTPVSPISSGKYDVYADFLAPEWGKESIVQTRLLVGQPSIQPFEGKPFQDWKDKKTPGGYLLGIKPLPAMSGLQLQVFDHEKRPLTTLPPYLGAPAHAVLMQVSNRRLQHVHPMNDAQQGFMLHFAPLAPNERYKLWIQVKTPSGGIDTASWVFDANPQGQPILSEPLPAARTTAKKLNIHALGQAITALAAGLLLKLLDALRKENRTLKGLPLLPAASHWSFWARLPMGVIAVNQLNKGINWVAPAWLNAIETTAVLTLLTAGLNKMALKDFIKIGSFVAISTAVANSVSQWLEKKLKTHFQIDPKLTRGLVTFASLAGGVVLYSKGYEPLIKKVPFLKWLHVDGTNSTGKAAASMLTQTCPRGCTPQLPGSPVVVCLTEMADMLGAKTSGMQSSYQSFTSQKKEKPSPPNDEHHKM